MNARRWCAAAMVFLLMAACSEPHSAVPFYRDATLTPEWLGERITNNPAFHHVAPFVLTDQQGATVSEHALVQHVTVVHFFFTSCAGVCPTTQGNLARLLASMPEASQLQILSHSVQPQHDSVPVLRAYAQLHAIHDTRWHLLTGQRQAIERLAGESYFVNLTDGRSYGVSDLAHTETLVLVDARGRLRGVYTGSLPFDIDRLRDDIGVLLARES